MTRFSHVMQSCALALCLPAGAAMADLTAAQVWTDWEDMMTSSGYTLKSDQSSAGGNLTVSDLSLEMDLGEGADQGSLTMQLGTLRFVENGDGSVTIEVPDTAEFEFSMQPDVGEDVLATLTATLTDPVMTAAGDPDDITYTFNTSKADMRLSDLRVDGKTLGRDIANASLSMDNLAYVTKTTLAGLRMIEQTTSASALAYQWDFADPNSTETFDMNGTVRDLTFTGGGSLPADLQTDDANAMLNAGLAFTGNFTTQGGGYNLTFSGDEGGGTLNTTSEGTDFEISLNPGGLAYEAAQRGISVNMLVTEFPVPLSFAAARMETNLLLPLQKSETDQNFALGVSLSDLALSDAIWGMFDPTGALPRTPANLTIDLGGTVKMMFDMLDPAQAQILEATQTPPGQVQTMTLNALDVEAAGAQLTGQGAFSFDNSDVVTFDGIPRPEGGLDLTLTGANVLIDTLVGMGLLPQEQAMGARMMMGLFAVPGDGADTLTSRIEITPEGHVMANGQRLR